MSSNITTKTLSLKSNKKNSKKELSEDNSYFSYLNKEILRPKTAPPRPLTKIEQFKKSKYFFYIEKLFIISTNFIKINNNRFEIESISSQNYFNSYLKTIEKFIKFVDIKLNSRAYRMNFSKAYQVLYNQNDILYLTEILDSAQDAVTCLYINNEKYDFEPLVIFKGNKLFKDFILIYDFIKFNFVKLNYDYSINNFNIEEFKKEFKSLIETFDKSWVSYEEFYIYELMKIERQARKKIIDIIEINNKFSKLEAYEKLKGFVYHSKEYNNLRKEFVDKIDSLLSNINLEERDGNIFSDILVAAESTLCKISPSQSMSIRKLCNNIKYSFINFRNLLKKYEENIETIDPQLRNNLDMVECLEIMEKYWNRGKKYLLNKTKFNQILYFSNYVEGIIEKYDEVKVMIDDRDYMVFVFMPMLIVFKSIEQGDKGILAYFLPDITNTTTKAYQLYNNLKNKIFILNTNTSNNKPNKLAKSYIINKSIDNKKINNKYNNSLYLKKDNPKLILLNKKRFIDKQGLSHTVYNLIEKILLEMNLNNKENIMYNNNFKLISEIVNEIKQISIQMERSNPCEWNSFLDIVLDNQSSNTIS